MGIFKTWSDNRVKRKELKWNSFSTAYAKGIDPRKGVADAAADIVGHAASAFVGGGGAKGDPKIAAANAASNAFGEGGGLSNLFPMLILAFLAFMLIRK